MSDLLDFSPPGQATFSLAGAKARFYDAGTTTPRTVYADEAETVPHPSPLLADSNGRFAQAFVSGGAVKVVVTQSDDSTGYTLDPCVKVAATGSAAGSVSFTPSVLRPQTNVQDAIDDGTFPARTITGTANQIAVADGDGASGNPTISAVVASQAEAIAGTDTTKLMTAQRTKQAMNASGDAPMFACRAWVSFTGVTTATIRGSGNVSSVVRNSTGDYTINFTTAMQDVNYAVVMSADVGGGSGDKGPYIQSQSTGNVRILNYNGSGSLTDTGLCSVVVFR